MKPLIADNITLGVGGETLFGPLSVTVEPGSVTTVTGPSGSGKSSFLKYLCGVLPAAFSASGSVRLGDEALDGKATEARGLGLLFQDPLLFPHLDVAGNLLFGLRGHGSRAERRQKVEDALASVGLEGMGRRDPATLSGGQQTRVALLRVLLSMPKALLLDEPFGALDEKTRRQVREIVFAEARRRQLPTLLVTHDEEDVRAAAGPVVRLAAG